LRDLLEMDQERYLRVIERSDNQVSRQVCYGKLAIIKDVLDFIEENKLIKEKT
jgi:hypothetical protein